MVAKIFSTFAVTAWFVSGTFASVEIAHRFTGASADAATVLAVILLAGFCGLFVDSVRYLAERADVAGARHLPGLRSVITKHILSR